jgi:hypothetical protein
VPGNGCVNTTPENCKVVQYPAEVPATGSISGNVITIDVPVQGGFGANRPIFGGTLYNVTALSAGRTPSELVDIYADLDATRSFDFGITATPPPPPGNCNIDGNGAISTGVGAEGTFSLNGHADLKGKVRYRDGAAANFRSTRLTEVTCGSGGHGTIRGEGTDNGQRVTFTIEVVDNGDSGTSDTFSISLSDGYSKSGTLTSGNVEVH